MANNQLLCIGYSIYISFVFVIWTDLQICIVRTRIDLNPKQEWIQAHVAQTMNL